MTCQYRLKPYRNEDGEYSDYLPCDESTILKIITNHWDDDNRPNGLEIISIRNPAGRSLLLEHHAKHVFEVYYLPKSPFSHYHKKSTIDVVYNSVAYFFAGQTEALLDSLNETTKEVDYIRGDYFFKDFTYEITEERNLQCLKWLFWGAIQGLSFFIPGTLILGWLLSAFPRFVYLIPVPLALIFLGMFLVVPGIRLHRKYAADNKGMKVTISKGNPVITVASGESVVTIHKSEIAFITQYSNPAYKNPWSDYGYTCVEMKNGDILNLTNLLIDQIDLSDKFANDNLEVVMVSNRLPKLKKRTSLKGIISL